MSIVFSAIVPHSPILIPQIGKENLKRLDATAKSYNELALDLEKSSPETILIISPHGIMQTNSFTMNMCPNYTGSFEDFGDFSTKMNWNGDVGLTHRIREKLETKAPLQLTSQEKLDHGTSIPLFLLTQKIPRIKVIPLYYSGMNLEAHFNFGKLLGHEALFNKERIALIASGDLSHRLTKDAPGGYSTKAKKFDKKLIDLLQKNKFSELTKFSQAEIAEAGECGLKSILILTGVLENIKHKPQLLSYEFPFGIGYLNMNFIL